MFFICRLTFLNEGYPRPALSKRPYELPENTLETATSKPNFGLEFLSHRTAKPTMFYTFSSNCGPYRSNLPMISRSRLGLAILSALSTLMLAGCTGLRNPPPGGGDLKNLNHIIVFVQENRSFDHYFGAMRAYWAKN